MNDNRQNDIIKLLYKNGRVSVEELSKTLCVSEMTIRRDLSQMERQGIVKRYRGGAVLISDVNDMPILQRFFVDEAEKKFLSTKASEFLSDGMTVYIDSSSTCQYLISEISKFKNIIIVTNSVGSLLIAAKMQIPCFLIGGKYYSRDMCFTGTIAEQYATQFNVDIAFFASADLSSDGIISDNDIEQTTIRKIIMKNSAKNIFLFEKAKLNTKYLYTLCHRNYADEILISE